MLICTCWFVCGELRMLICAWYVVCCIVYVVYIYRFVICWFSVLLVVVRWFACCLFSGILLWFYLLLCFYVCLVIYLCRFVMRLVYCYMSVCACSPICIDLYMLVSIWRSRSDDLYMSFYMWACICGFVYVDLLFAGLVVHWLWLVGRYVVFLLACNCFFICWFFGICSLLSYIRWFVEAHMSSCYC